jgi:hypothetical protein
MASQPAQFSERAFRRSWAPAALVRLAIFGAALLGLAVAVRPTSAADQSPVLEFIEPTNHAVFSTLDEVPVVLRGFATNDAFPSAEVHADAQLIGTAIYCCPFCPCAYPFEGQPTTLQIPVPWDGGERPPRTWQGWIHPPAGTHRLTAHATGRNGTMVEATPVAITVIDRTLRISLWADGTVALVIPQGSLTPGHYEAEASADLQHWTRLGPFEPGNVAAFYYDVPPENARAQRFYRSVYISPSFQVDR